MGLEIRLIRNTKNKITRRGLNYAYRTLERLNKSCNSEVNELKQEIQAQERVIAALKKQLKKMHALKAEVRDLRAEVLRARQTLETAYSNYANLCDTYEETQKDNLRLAESHIALENELKALSTENGRLKAYDSLLNSAKGSE